MNTFSLVQHALDATANDPTKVGLNAAHIETGRIALAVQTVVDALTPPEGGRYIVAFADIATAGTQIGERRITVSSKPLRDSSLSMVEKAVVIATFAAHEIGHTLVTVPRKPLIKPHNPHSGYHAVANLADDIILEPVMVDRFPILKDAFEFTGLWVLRSTAKELPKTMALFPGITTPERFNLLLNATRYGDIAEVIWADEAAVTDRDWSRAWAERLKAAKLNDHTTFLALCDEAWERIRSDEDVPEDEPEPGQGEPGEGEPEPQDDRPEPHEGEGNPGQNDNPDWDDDDDDDVEPGDEPGGPSSDEEDDEAEDDESEPGEGEGEGSDESEDSDGDEPDEDEGEDGSGDADGESEDESDGTTDSGESMDGADESDADSDEDGDSESDDDEGGDTDNIDGEGGGGDPTAGPTPVRDETDWNRSKVEESMHDSAERDPYDWAGRDVEDIARTYASTTVTSFGRHGSIGTVWD